MSSDDESDNVSLHSADSSTDTEVPSNGLRDGIKVRWPVRFVNSPDQLSIPRICNVCLLDPEEPTILGCGHMTCTYHLSDEPFPIGPPRRFGGNWSMLDLITEQRSQLPVTTISLLRSMPQPRSRSARRLPNTPRPGLHVSYPQRFLGWGRMPHICVICLRQPDELGTKVLGCGHLVCYRHLSDAPYLTGSPGYFSGHWPEGSPATSPIPRPWPFTQNGPHRIMPSLPLIEQDDTDDLAQRLNELGPLSSPAQQDDSPDQLHRHDSFMSNRPFPPRPSSPVVSESPDTSITTTEPDSDAEYCHHSFPRFTSHDLISPTTPPASVQPVPTTISENLDDDDHTLERSSRPTTSSAISGEPSGTASSLSPAPSSVYFDAVSFIASDASEAEDTPTPGPLSTSPPPSWVPDRTVAGTPPPPYEPGPSGMFVFSAGRHLDSYTPADHDRMAQRINDLEAAHNLYWDERQRRMQAAGAALEHAEHELGREGDDSMDIDSEGVPSP